MLLGLAALSLASALPEPRNDFLNCSASFADRGRFGNVFLLVDGNHRALKLTASINEPDGWSRAELALDPADRRLPGLLSHAYFAVRFDRPRPAFPLRMDVYADSTLRWRRSITVPFWPSSLSGPDSAARDPGAASDRKKVPGTVHYVAGADDGLPVPTPGELRIVIFDAAGRQVGETRFPLVGPEPEGPMATALSAVESAYRARACSPPPPPIH